MCLWTCIITSTANSSCSSSKGLNDHIQTSVTICLSFSTNRSLSSLNVVNLLAFNWIFSTIREIDVFVLFLMLVLLVRSQILGHIDNRVNFNSSLKLYHGIRAISSLFHLYLVELFLNKKASIILLSSFESTFNHRRALLKQKASIQTSSRSPYLRSDVIIILISFCSNDILCGIFWEHFRNFVTFGGSLWADISLALRRHYLDVALPLLLGIVPSDERCFSTSILSLSAKLLHCFGIVSFNNVVSALRSTLFYSAEVLFHCSIPFNDNCFWFFFGGCLSSTALLFRHLRTF